MATTFKPSSEPVPLRELKIKTGVAKRTGKELASYQKEHEKQQARIDKLIADGAHDADVRKQREVLAETTQILPDTRRRLLAARKDLADLVAKFEPEATGEDIEGARQVLSETAIMIESS